MYFDVHNTYVPIVAAQNIMSYMDQNYQDLLSSFGGREVVEALMMVFFITRSILVIVCFLLTLGTKIKGTCV